MLLEKLETGILAFETDQGLVYAEPTGWQRLYLLWTFRNFRSLPLKLLNARQRKLVESLEYCGSTCLLDAPKLTQVIGTVEGAAIHLPSDLDADLPEVVESGKAVEALGFQTFRSYPATVRIPKVLPLPKASPTVNAPDFSTNINWNKVGQTVAVSSLGALLAIFVGHGLQSPPSSNAGQPTAKINEAPAQQFQIQNETKLAVAESSSASLQVAPEPAKLQTAQPNLSPVPKAPPELAEAKIPMLAESLPTPKAEAKISRPVETKPSGTVTKSVAVNENKHQQLPLLASIPAATVPETSARIQFSRPPHKIIYPDYPQTKVRGKVSLKAMVDVTGRVREVKILSGNNLLSKAAARAVKLWHYDPFYKDGAPVETEANVRMLFVSADVISISFPDDHLSQ